MPFLIFWQQNEFYRIFAALQIDSDIQIRYGFVDTTTEVASTTIDYPYVKKLPSLQADFYIGRKSMGCSKCALWGQLSSII